MSGSWWFSTLRVTLRQVTTSPSAAVVGDTWRSSGAIGGRLRTGVAATAADQGPARSSVSRDATRYQYVIAVVGAVDVDALDRVAGGQPVGVPGPDVEEPGLRRGQRLPVEAGVHVVRDGLGVHLLERAAGARGPLHDERGRVGVAVPQHEHAAVAGLGGHARRRVGEDEVPGPHRDVDGQPAFLAVGQHAAELVEVVLVGLHAPVRVGEAGGVAHGQVGLGRGPHQAQLALGEPALEAGRGVRELEGAGAARGRGEAPGERLPLGRSLRDRRLAAAAPTTVERSVCCR